MSVVAGAGTPCCRAGCDLVIESLPGLYPQHSKILLPIREVGLWLCGKVLADQGKVLYVHHHNDSKINLQGWAFR